MAEGSCSSPQTTRGALIDDDGFYAIDLLFEVPAPGAHLFVQASDISPRMERPCVDIPLRVDGQSCYELISDRAVSIWIVPVRPGESTIRGLEDSSPGYTQIAVQPGINDIVVHTIKGQGRDLEAVQAGFRQGEEVPPSKEEKIPAPGTPIKTWFVSKGSTATARTES